MQQKIRKKYEEQVSDFSSPLMNLWCRRLHFFCFFWFFNMFKIFIWMFVLCGMRRAIRTRQITPTLASERFASCSRQTKVERCSNSRSSWPYFSCCTGTGHSKRCVKGNAHARRWWLTTHTGHWTTTCALKWHSTGSPENRFTVW